MVSTSISLLSVPLQRSCCGQLWVRHVFCGRNLCWTIIFSIDRVGIPFGFQTIRWTLARHLVSRCLYLPIPTYGSTWVVLWLLFFRSAPALHSLTNGPLLRVRFKESLVVRLYSEIDQIHHFKTIGLTPPPPRCKFSVSASG